MYILHLLIISLLCINCQSFKEKSGSENFRFVLMDLRTKDTLLDQPFNSANEKITFQSPKNAKHTALVASVHFSESQINLVLPVQTGSLNYYTINTKLLNEMKLGALSINQPVIKCSGNQYLDAYSLFLEEVNTVDQDSIIASNKYVKSLFNFKEKYKAQDIIGYHVYSIVNSTSGKSFENNLNVDMKRIWQELQTNSNDFFVKELIRINKANEGVDCVQSGKDKLVFQSKNSSIHPALLNGNIKVVIFWATWCGPCKPQMKTLAELNQSKYLEKPVFFIGVTSESDRELVFSWMKKNESKYQGLSLFHDSQFCMGSNYQITQYPTIMVFDKNDRLVKGNIKIDEVESLIDSLLVN